MFTPSVEPEPSPVLVPSWTAAPWPVMLTVLPVPKVRVAVEMLTPKDCPVTAPIAVPPPGGVVVTEPPVPVMVTEALAPVMISALLSRATPVVLRKFAVDVAPLVLMGPAVPMIERTPPTPLLAPTTETIGLDPPRPPPISMPWAKLKRLPEIIELPPEVSPLR